MIEGFIVEVINKNYEVESKYSIDPHYAVDKFAANLLVMEKNNFQSVGFRKTSSNQPVIITPTSVKPKWAVVVCPPEGGHADAIVTFYYTDLTEEDRKRYFEQLKAADEKMLAFFYNMQTRRITDRLNGYFDDIQY